MTPIPLPLEVGAGTETGYVRQENQDRMSWANVPLGQLYIVADGMGGHAGGARAAQLTVQGLERYLAEASKNTPVDAAIRQAFQNTNRDVYVQAHSGDPKTERMGSTAVMLLAVDRLAKIAHVGDSRAYLYRKGRLRRLTRDHTRVQRMVDEGILTSEQARNHPFSSVLDRAIGNHPDVDVDIGADLALKNGDGILLCSDGLSGYVDDGEITAVMDDALPPQSIVDRLINLALEKGGEDNITVQFIRFGKSPVYLPVRVSKRLKSILWSVLILAMAGGAGHGLYLSATQSDAEAPTPISGDIPRQNRIVLYFLHFMRELADRAANAGFCISDFDAYKAQVIQTEKKSLHQISDLENQLHAARQARQDLENKLAAALREKHISETQSRLKSKQLAQKVSLLTTKVKALTARLDQSGSPPRSIVQEVPKQGGKSGR